MCAPVTDVWTPSGLRKHVQPQRALSTAARTSTTRTEPGAHARSRSDPGVGWLVALADVCPLCFGGGWRLRLSACSLRATACTSAGSSSRSLASATSARAGPVPLSPTPCASAGPDVLFARCPLLAAAGAGGGAAGGRARRSGGDGGGATQRCNGCDLRASRSRLRSRARARACFVSHTVTDR